ncbi:MAG: hypothetical protein V4725_18530 [Bacteroidota bacterium]
MSRYLALFLPLLLILAVGFICGLFHYKRKKNLRPVIVLLGVTLVSEMLSYYLAKYYRNNMPLAHVFNPIQLCFWSVFFYRAIDDGRIKRLILWVTMSMLLFATLNSIFLQPLNTFPGNFIQVETMLLILLGSYLFILRLDAPSELSIFKDPMFITAIALIWFNLVSFLFFLLYAYMAKHNLPVRTLRTIHLFSNYVYYLLLLLAILLPQKKLQDAGKIQQ